MNNIAKAVAAIALGTSSLVSLGSAADAATRHHRHHYYGRTAYHACRYSSGRTGLIAGGVAGAVAGPSIVGHGILGAAAGAVGGAIAGRAIDRTATAHRRCR